MRLLSVRTLGDAPTFLGEVAAPTGIPTTDVSSVTGNFINGILGTVGILFFLLMVYGGYLWLTSRGAEEQVTKAKNIIMTAVIGMVVVVAAYAVTTFITGSAVRSITGGGDASELRN